MIVAALIGTLGLVMWLWHRHRDPLVYLVPVALAFPPLIAYGGKALGWPGAWLSTRVALVLCIVVFLVFRLARRDFSWRRIEGIRFVTPYFLLVTASVLWGVLGQYNGDAGTIANEFLSWAILVTVFFCIAGSTLGESNLNGAILVLLVVGLC